MTQLLIAEKPSVAKDIAQVLNATRRRQGYLEGPGWIVTWCIGHLVELIEPHEYDPAWKPWRLDVLPMLPQTFRLRPVASTADQLQNVMGLLRRPDLQAVVNACDAGREGELIFRYVYELAHATLPIRRLWISSMTEEAIKDGLAHLRPGREFDALAAAARSRSEADWLVGLNATRAITVRSRQGQAYRPDAPLYSIGRVQTPTLAILVNRELEIRKFKPEDYWQLQATFENPKGTWVGRWFALRTEAGETTTVDRFSSLADAQAVQARVEGKLGMVLEVEQKRTKEPPPQLFDLTRLQRTANKRYGFSAARTLELAQALYERHKLLTYPRTDSMHLSTDMVPKLKPTLTTLRLPPYLPFADRLLALEKLPISKRFVDDAKVSDHHAIIQTTTTPRLHTLSEDERRIYDLVVRRFLGVFFPDALFDRTRVVTGVEGETFVTRGRVLVDAGWREVAGFKDDEPKKRRSAEEDSDREDDDEDEQGVLPPLKKKDPAQVEAVELLVKQTQPPPRYTEATLLAAMETAGRRVEEEELARAMKDRGLGTPATRASIIETLLQRAFIVRKGKLLVPLEKGIRLIGAVPVESLKSPVLTGEWEARLARMARSEYDAEVFRQEVVAYVRDVVDRIKRSQPIALQAEAEQLADLQIASAANASEHAASSAGETRGRGNPHAEAERRGAARTRRGAAALPAETSASVEDAAGPEKTKSGKKRVRTSGKASAGESGTAEAAGASAPKKKRSKKGGESMGEPQALLPLEEPGCDDPGPLGTCTACGGPVGQRPDGFVCERSSLPGCFRLKRTLASNHVTAKMVAALLAEGRTRVYRGFVSPKSGVPFCARLLLKPEGGVGFEFVPEAGQSLPQRDAKPKEKSVDVAPAGHETSSRTPKAPGSRSRSPRATPGAQSSSADTVEEPNKNRAMALAPLPENTLKPAETPSAAGQLSLLSSPAPGARASVASAASAHGGIDARSEPRLLSQVPRDAERQKAPDTVTMGRQVRAVAEKSAPSAAIAEPEGLIDQVTSPIGVALGPCPTCRRGEVIAGRRAWGCSRWREGCSFVLPFQIAGRELSEGEARRLLSQGRLGPLKGLVLEGQEGVPGAGTLILRQGKVEVLAGTGGA